MGQHHQEPVVAAFLDASQAKDQALAEQEAARQRELEATQKLAEERERAATVLRRRAWVLAGVGVVSLLLAIIAFWSYLEAGWAKDTALRGQSLFLADLARQQNEKSNFVVGMLLALEALPKSMARSDRPYVPEADFQLYEAAVNQRERFVLTGHQGSVTHVVFSPDGSRLATASPADHTVWLWRVFPNTQALIDYANSIRPRISDGKTTKLRELTPDERKQFFLLK